ncbi:amino acid adenylation domain-containing protein, partial [Chitinophaga niastensis]
KLYRTGDLVKYSPEGDIVFLGRSDDQVKIRGYRVEPGEISRILNECSLVDQGLVVVKGDNSDSKRLIGYVIPQGDFDRDGIISYLRAIVPEYMVPSLLISITKFPLLANGKIDKRGLPDPDSIDSPTGYIAPQTFLEKELAKIWSVLLEVETIGINDDFFSLGGHSLLAIRLISLIRKQLGVEVVIGDIFDYPTIATLSRQLTLHAGISVVPAIVPAQRPLHIPLSYSQERLWFIDQLEGSVQYHVPVVLRLNGSLHKNALTYALQTIINRHEVLRTVIVQEAGIAYQQLKEKDKWELTVIDNDVFREDEALLQSYIESLITAPFDLSQDYMLRAHLVILGIKEHVLVITLHHIASDGWSTSIIVRELAELYGSYTEARAAALPSLDIQYIDYAIWQRNYLTGPLLVEKLNYWKEKLTGVSMLQLPADYVRPAVQSSRGASSRLLLDKVLSDQLQVLSLQQGATLFMTLLAAFKVLLYRYSGQEDICVGSPTAGRTQQETEGLIGFFVNTLALRSDLGNDPSFISLLQQVKQTTLGAYMHQEVPFEKVVEAVVKNRDMSMHPLFQVLFVMQNVPGIPELRLGTVQLSVAPFEHTTSQFDLTIALAEGPDGLYGSIEYCTDLFSAATINRMIIHFEELLRSIVKSPEIPISALSMLPPDEMHQLLVSQNNTAVDYPQDQVITDLFALQVKRAPGAIAAVFEVSQLTYRELDERSNQLAHYLHNKGVGAETLVPICIDRSLEMIIGIMGILKAGGAYVPIDPEYPLDRIAFMLSDINAALLLTNAAHADQLKSVAGLAEIISLDEQWHYIAQEPLSPVDIVIASHHLAYVIYTSGSTGIPKGVMNEHGGVINRLQWAQDYFNLHSSDVILQKTTFCFDVSVWELLWPLITGARLVFALPDGHKDAGYLKAMIAQHKVTTIHFVPSMLTVFLESISSGDGADLRRVICSGEALAPQQVPAFRDKLPAAELYNLYGPTEAAIDVSYWHASRDINDISIVPIGKPISNTRLYILDKRGNVVPTGVTGELYIGGIQVARGYLNRLELTEEKFIVDPFSLDVTEKMYRTGDLCKWLPDGNIAYVGRVDHQVKVRGYRIELGEIENVLLECKLVSEVVVLANVVNNAVHLPDTRLVAYIVPNGQFDKAGIIAYLKDKLPEYMIPVSFTEIGAIPLTANGKIDRRALPDPGNQALSLHEYVAPASAMEQLLADIWQQLLGLERVGLHDNFFELGGHSLLAMRLISIIRETFNVEMSVKFFFQLPTIESQARHITISRNDSTSHHTDTKIIKL